MEIVIAFLSLVALVIGFLFLSEATMGVGIIAIGGVLAIFARMAQAGNHQGETRKDLETIRNLLTPQYVERTGSKLETGPTNRVTRKELRRMVAEKEAAAND